MPADSLSQTPPAARLIDLSRLCATVGKGQHTGIDRVEAQYLKALMAAPEPLFALVRLGETFFLLDPDGTGALAARLSGNAPWGAPIWRDRLRRKARPEQRAVRSDLRRLAVAQSGPRDLAPLFRDRLPDRTTWVNVGQVNLLHREVFDAIHAVPGGRATVMVHDLIPFSHPEFMVPRSVAQFAHKMRHVAELADLVICSTDVTRAAVEAHCQKTGRMPPVVAAHLGVDRPRPDRQAAATVIDPTRPYFVALGTIEPRKNHALLLDIWDHFAATLSDPDIPGLVIVGRRGWMNEATFNRLDSSPLIGRHVFEAGSLEDDTAAGLIAGAKGLLMPSLVEGFGFPPGEALSLGTPALVNDLPVYREVFGNNLIYADGTDMYPWAEKILDLARAEKKGQKAADGTIALLPTWNEHFNLVLKVT